MVNRPAGGARSKRHERAPLDWYLDDVEHVAPLFDRIDFGDSLIWDPCCGRGNILDVAQARGHLTFGSDLVERADPFRPSPRAAIRKRHAFEVDDFLVRDHLPSTGGRPLSIVCNPPYGYVDNIAERIIRKALTLPIYRAAFVVPIAFLSSNERWEFFARQFKPSHVAVLSDRPTMPPGHLAAQMATPFRGGMADYVWIAYRPPHRWRTETIWLPGPRTPGA